MFPKVSIFIIDISYSNLFILNKIKIILKDDQEKKLHLERLALICKKPRSIGSKTLYGAAF